jgi:YD repeat-containing protein
MLKRIVCLAYRCEDQPLPSTCDPRNLHELKNAMQRGGRFVTYRPNDICRLMLVFVTLLSGLLQFDALAANTNYVYDANGRVVGVIDSSGAGMKYTYDAAGNVTAIKSAGAISLIEFTPRSGPIGTTVSLFGTGFSTTAGQNTVTFNGTAAVVNSASATTLVVQVPAGATTGTIAVTTPSGTATSSAPFTISSLGTNPNGGISGNNPPLITSFSPTIGPAGSAVTLTGTGFTTTVINERVEFNSVLSVVYSTSATTLSTSVPSGIGSGRISVQTPWGRAYSSTDFFVPPAPYTAANVAVTDRLVPNAPAKTVTLSTTSTIGMLVFDAIAGQKVSFLYSGASVTPATSYFGLTINKPDGSYLTNTSLFGSSGLYDAVTMPVTGTYTLVVGTPSGTTGSIALSVQVFNDVTGTITPNGPAVTVTTTVPGQNAVYTFNGTAGQKVSTILSNANYSPAAGYVSLGYNKPDGSYLSNAAILSSPGFYDAVTLPVTGTYTLIVDPSGTRSGTVTIALQSFSDIVGTITPNGPAVTVTTTVPGQNAVYTFSATAGQKVSAIVNSANNSPPSANIGAAYVKPDGSYITNTAIISSFYDAVALPVTGTYTLVIDPSGTSTTNMFLSLLTFNDVTGTITPNGPPVTFATTVPGQNAVYSFNATAGQTVSFALSGVSYASPSAFSFLQINKPDGSYFTNMAMFGAFGLFGPMVLPVAGTYTFIVDPTGTALLTSLTASLTSP